MQFMLELLKFLIYFCCASIFMGYLYIQMQIDLLAMEQQFILLALIEMTLPTQTSLMVNVWFDSRESKGWTLDWLGRKRVAEQDN